MEQGKKQLLSGDAYVLKTSKNYVRIFSLGRGAECSV